MLHSITAFHSYVLDIDFFVVAYSLHLYVILKEQQYNLFVHLFVTELSPPVGGKRCCYSK